MQIKFLAMGVGATVPYVGVGVNMAAGVYIQLRYTSADSPYVLGIATGLELGDDNGTLFGSYVHTDWIQVDPTKHPWICSKTSMIGKLAEVSITGTLLFKGKADIKFSIIGADNEEEFGFEKVDIKTTGAQLIDTRVRGKLVDMMGKMNTKILECSK